MKKQGLVYLFTGDGKGKTSAALGTALRASLSGQKVAWISWYKSEDWEISERNMASILPNVDCYFMGKGFFIKGLRIKDKELREETENSKSEILNPKQIQNPKSKINNEKLKQNNSPLVKEGTQPKARGEILSLQIQDKYLKQEHQYAAQLALVKALEILKSQKYFLLVCDEIVNTLADKLLTFKQIEALINQRGKTHLVLTGRNAPLKLIKLADLVTKMTKIKHPYDFGISAVKGLDF